MRCAINQRYKLEHLCRYITRPAISNERLTLNRASDVVLQLKSPYHDGTTHIVMAPLESMQRVAALWNDLGSQLGIGREHAMEANEMQPWTAPKRPKP